MHIPTHLLSGALIGNILTLNRYERMWCIGAAAAADLDGLGIFISAQAYAHYHHVYGHNWLAALLLGGVAACFFKRRLLMAGLTVLLMHVHFALDMIGSGRGPDLPWGIRYLFPFSHKSYAVSWGWELGGWQNYVCTAAMLMALIIMSIKQKRRLLIMLVPILEQDPRSTTATLATVAPENICETPAKKTMDH